MQQKQFTIEVRYTGSKRRLAQLQRVVVQTARHLNLAITLLTPGEGTVCLFSDDFFAGSKDIRITGAKKGTKA